MLSFKCSFVLVAATLAISTQFAAASPSVEVTSSPRTLYSAKASGCGPDIIPDSPARAFRRADGNIELIAAHFEDWDLVGRNFGSLRSNCQSIMDYNEYHNDVPGQLWIQAVYTLDGRRIEGIASQDLSTTARERGCDPQGHPGRCWVNQLISIRSGDMGNHFIPGPVVASYTDKYPESELGQFGFFATTNIVHQGPFYYAIFFQSPPRDQGLSGGMTQSGNCLFRTNNFLNPESWRGWNGAGFTYNPNKGRAQCTLVAPAGTDIFRSIAYVPKLGQWIATTAGRHRMPGDSQPVPGFYTLTSTDLLHWGGLTRIMPVPMAPRTDSMDSVYSYPSLIDPDSTSRNFETLDHDSAILVFSVHHLRNGAGTRNRDLQYVGVRIR